VASNDYAFVTRWRVPGTVEAVYDVLITGIEYPRWWPEVYLEVDEIALGGEHGLGKVGRLLTKGKLPYRLRWEMRVTEVRYPYGFTLEATGDFLGRGIWTFEQVGPDVDVTFDWQLRAEKPLLRYLSFVFKPIFRANHHWAMARGEESLKRELQRRTGRAR
jgi:hypothetical protein